MSAQKVCPLVVRSNCGTSEVLAFQHPNAGRQFVKGTIEPWEAPQADAQRELFEESGLVVQKMQFLGRQKIGSRALLWHFYVWKTTALPETWTYQTKDDKGHEFAFFWQRLEQRPDHYWHCDFIEAYDFFAAKLSEQAVDLFL